MLREFDLHADALHSWRRAPETPVLEPDMLHIWCASLLSMPVTVQSLWETLTPDEICRAERFYFQKDRDHFIVARGLLRSILSRYVDMPPNRLQLCYSPCGKPALAKTSNGQNIRFNLSHSNGLALYGITRDREVGIDIEYITADFPGLQVAEQFFSPREVALLRALPAPARRKAFFTFWTLKEAYVKCRGEGLTLSLTHLDVSAGLEARAPLHLSRWSLEKLAPIRDYGAAIAVEGDAYRLNRCYFHTDVL